MLKRIYAGNLPDDLDDAALAALFAPFGAVISALVVRDPESDRSRGFGFVEMADADAERAIAELDGLVMDCPEPGAGMLRVNESRDRGQPAPRRPW